MKSVLLVEDDRRLAAHWQSILEAHPYRVIHETTAKGAIQVLDETTVDLVITDIVLADEDEQFAHAGGLAVISHVLSNDSRRPPIIVASGIASDSTFVDQDFRKLDSLKVLRKPVNDHMLLSATGELLANPEFQRSESLGNRLRESMESDHAMLDLLGTHDGVWDWDVGGGDMVFAPGFRRLLGFDEDDTTSFPDSRETFAERIHPEDRDMLWREVNLSFSQQSPFSLEYRLRKCDDSYVWVRTQASVSFSEQGEAVRMVGSTQNISREHAARQELSRAQQALDSAPDAIFWTDTNARFLYVNQQACNSLRYSREELLAMSIEDVDPEVSNEYFQSTLMPKFSTGSKLNFATIHRRKDGTEFTAEVSASLLHFGEDQVVCAYVRDITERVALEKQAARTQFFTDHSQEAIYWLREDSRFEYVNDAACDMLGYSREQLLSLRAVHVDANFPPDVWQEFWPQLRTEGYCCLEAEHKRSDGSTVSVEARLHFVRFGGEEFIVVVTRDITEQKAAGQALRVSRRRFQDVANIKTPCWITEADGNCSWLNRQWIEYTGIGLEEQLGLGWTNAIHPEDVESARATHRAGVDRQEGFTTEYRLRRHDGRYRLFQSTARVRLDEHGAFDGFSGYSVDIQDERDTLAKLERSNAELEQFAYIASHDLRQPLTGIDKLAAWVEEDVGELLPAESLGHLRKIGSRVQRLKGLLDDLHAYSRAGRASVNDRRVDLAELIAYVTETLAPPPHVTIEQDLQLTALVTQQSLLETTLRNLIGNAIKHGNQEHCHVTITSTAKGRLATFSVTDNGPGIEPEFHERIFRLFQTLKPRDEVEGSGMGLSIVEKIVSAQGGRVWVESPTDRGAKFVFSWPFDPLKAAPEFKT